ncbi:MAG: hypothetical protein SFV54_00880 [Bryobacteraceae bacterium]|nr:hypothetical protein [Bryobacteraceae bacterium]
MTKLTSFALFALAVSPLLAQSPNARFVNAATFEQGFPVAPGSLVTAFPVPANGAFTGAGTALQEALPWPTTLGNVRVLVGPNSTPSPLYYVSPGQINFQLPSSATPGLMYIVIQVNGATVAQGSVQVGEVSPGVFERSARPNPQAAIRNEDNAINDATARAARGSVIQIFGTGSGPLATPLPDGLGATQAIDSVRRPRVFISAVEAELQYSGASAFPGLWQVNAVVPDRPFISGRVPLVILLDGVLSNNTSFWVVD